MKPRTALRADEKVEDPETVFERFKQTVALIAVTPKNGSNGTTKSATVKKRKKPTS